MLYNIIHFNQFDFNFMGNFRGFGGGKISFALFYIYTLKYCLKFNSHLKINLSFHIMYNSRQFSRDMCTDN